MRDWFGETQVYVQWQKAAEEQKRFDKTKTLSCFASRDYPAALYPLRHRKGNPKLGRKRWAPQPYRRRLVKAKQRIAHPLHKTKSQRVGHPPGKNTWPSIGAGSVSGVILGPLASNSVASSEIVYFFCGAAGGCSLVGGTMFFSLM